MKNILSYIKTAVILLIVTIISIGFYVYMIARPISYGFSYHHKTVYEGELFEGTIKFNPNGTMVILNTTFKEAVKSRYYYKDGNIFLTMAETEEEYQKEVAYINENFEEAINTPFYATKINAFRQIAEGVDGYTSIYTCTAAIIFAVVGAVIELILIGITLTSFVFCKKSKQS